MNQIVPLDRVAAAAFGFTPCDVTHAPAGAVLVAADGTALRVTAAGGLDPVDPFGFKSIASDPTARFSARGDHRHPTCSPRSTP